MDEKDRHEAGMKVRREILGDAHVERAVTGTNDVNREFQDLITRYAWGEIWTRPDLDHRTRRILVLGTMMALGRWEEFAMHARAALRGGMALADVKEIILQQAVYCGVPVANTAHHHLGKVLAGLEADGVRIDTRD